MLIFLTDRKLIELLNFFKSRIHNSLEKFGEFSVYPPNIIRRLLNSSNTAVWLKRGAGNAISFINTICIIFV